MADSAIKELNPDGSFSSALKLEGAGENDANHYIVTRDMQCCVVMSLEAAINVRDQLNYFIKVSESLTEAHIVKAKNK